MLSRSQRCEDCQPKKEKIKLAMAVLFSSLPWGTNNKSDTGRTSFVSEWNRKDSNSGTQEDTRDGAGTHKPWCSLGTSNLSRLYNEHCTGCRRDRALKPWTSSSKPLCGTMYGGIQVGSLYSSDKIGSLYSNDKKKKK